GSTGGSIVQGSLAAQITGKNVVLTAAGSVGGVTWTGSPSAPVAAPVAVMLTGGALTATAANGNVALTSRGSLVVDQVTATGSVNLLALGAIQGKDGNAR